MNETCTKESQVDLDNESEIIETYDSNDNDNNWRLVPGQTQILFPKYDMNIDIFDSSLAKSIDYMRWDGKYTRGNTWCRGTQLWIKCAIDLRNDTSYSSKITQRSSLDGVIDVLNGQCSVKTLHSASDVLDAFFETDCDRIRPENIQEDHWSQQMLGYFTKKFNDATDAVAYCNGEENHNISDIFLVQNFNAILAELEYVNKKAKQHNVLFHWV